PEAPEATLPGSDYLPLRGLGEGYSCFTRKSAWFVCKLVHVRLYAEVARRRLTLSADHLIRGYFPLHFITLPRRARTCNKNLPAYSRPAANQVLGGRGRLPF